MFLPTVPPSRGIPCLRPTGRLFTAAGLALVLGLAGGCGSDGDVDLDNASAPASTSPTSSPTVDPDETAILAAYREFFARQTEISMAPKEQRRVLLEPFTTNPALERVLRGMFAAEELGEVGYGEPVVDPEVETIDGDTATVTDCQDGRNAGRKKRDGDKITTRGMKDTKVVATAERGDDGQWRMATFAYPEEPC